MSASRILLVEDDQNFGDVLKSYLEMNEYDVTLAADGVLGLETYRKGSFDLCIFDVMMPRKDGFTLAREVREKDKEMPIIFLTAKTSKEDILEGFKIGADDYLAKPFNSEELLLRHPGDTASRPQGSRKEDDVKEYQIGEYIFNYPLRILTWQGGSGNEKESYSLRKHICSRCFASIRMMSSPALKHLPKSGEKTTTLPQGPWMYSSRS